MATAASSKIYEGVFAINKPTGISSAQVLRNLQRHFDSSQTFAPWIASETQRREDEFTRQNRHQKKKRLRAKSIKDVSVKIGHGGTLDPIATGVLIAGIGTGTKSLSSFLDCTKSYETVVLFGVATDTYDRVGKVVGRKPFSHITKEMVVQALGKFRGKIMQRPPIFSALRIDGKRLYEYAREGKALPRELEERPMEVRELELVEWLEGGTHSFAWPSEEASTETKSIASELLHVGAEGGGATPRQSNSEILEEQVDESATADSTAATRVTLKRKRSPASDDAEVEDALLEEGPYMSGALHPAAAAEKADDKIKQATGNEDDKTAKKDSTTAVGSLAPAPVPAPAARIRMTVTSGFYVRSFCHDLGESLNSLAIMADLVRTRQANFKLGENVLEYSELEKGEAVWGPQVKSMLNGWNDSLKREHEQSPSR